MIGALGQPQIFSASGNRGNKRERNATALKDLLECTANKKTKNCSKNRDSLGVAIGAHRGRRHVVSSLSLAHVSQLASTWVPGISKSAGSNPVNSCSFRP